jgi:hypothetical protein
MVRLASYSQVNKYILYFLLGLFVVFLLFWLLSLETDDPYSGLRSLDEDGYVVITTYNNTSKKNHITESERHQTILQKLPKGYTFLKYKYIIRGCSLSTFHRDVTSSQYIYDTKYPIYTYIEYTIPDNHIEPVPLLTVCPKSNTTTPFVYSSPVIIRGTGNMGVLFHCDLLHAGAINQLGKFRYAEQYKIAHVEDIAKLSHLQNIHMEKNGKCNISPFYEYISRRISWIFAHIANHHFTSYLQTRPDTLVGKFVLSLYGREFYNRGDQGPP